MPSGTSNGTLLDIGAHHLVKLGRYEPPLFLELRAGSHCERQRGLEHHLTSLVSDTHAELTLTGAGETIMSHISQGSACHLLGGRKFSYFQPNLIVDEALAIIAVEEVALPELR